MRRELGLFLAAVVVLALLPLAIGGNLIVMQLLILCMIYAVVAQAWDLVMGVAGLFTFGQIAFMAIGAYGSAIISMRLGLSPWLAMPVAACISAVVGAVVGLICLRLRGDYVALLTFAIQLLLAPFIISDWGKALGTGGTKGLVGIPRLSVGGYRFQSLELRPWFYAALGLFVVGLLVIYLAMRSNWGRAFVALRDSPRFAKGLGVNEFKYKLLVFALSALLTGLAGAFYVHYTGVLSVKLLNGLDLFLLLLIMQVVGGMGRFFGAALGAFIITFVNDWLRFAESYRPMVFGAAIILLVILFPQGILGSIWSKGPSGPFQRLGAPVRRRLAAAVGGKGDATGSEKP